MPQQTPYPVSTAVLAANAMRLANQLEPMAKTVLFTWGQAWLKPRRLFSKRWGVSPLKPDSCQRRLEI
jgi:hypothetical protein